MACGETLIVGNGQLPLIPLLLGAAERTNIREIRPTQTRRLYRPRPGDLEALEF